MNYTQKPILEPFCVYYIDAYNLIFRFLKRGEELRAMRETLIEDLRKKADLLDIRLILVFDSHYYAGEGSRSHKGGLEIVYTDQGQSADDYIIFSLKPDSYARKCIVVTSDKKLAWRARRSLAQTETIERFSASLEKRYYNKIRREKEEKKPLEQQVTERVATLQHKKEEIKTVVVGSEEYYLKSFQAELAEEVIQPVKEEEITIEEKVEKSKDVEENVESELERWERIFSKGMSKENGA